MIILRRLALVWWHIFRGSEPVKFEGRKKPLWIKSRLFFFFFFFLHGKFVNIRVSYVLPSTHTAGRKITFWWQYTQRETGWQRDWQTDGSCPRAESLGQGRIFQPVLASLHYWHLHDFRLAGVQADLCLSLMFCPTRLKVGKYLADSVKQGLKPEQYYSGRETKPI